MEAVKALRREISSLHATAPLALLCLYAGGLNQELADRADRLAERIATFQVEENRQRNKRYTTTAAAAAGSYFFTLETTETSDVTY